MEKKIKILHLEDSQNDIDLVGRELNKAGINYERVIADTRDEFVQALNEFYPDVILADHSFPSFNSYEALSLLKKEGVKIPFILVTGNTSEPFAAGVIQKGADDYIFKDRLQRLPVAIINALEKCSLEKEKQLLLEQLVKNEKKYRTLVENGADAILIIDKTGKTTYVSASIEKVLGYSQAEAREMDMLDLLHPDDQPGIIERLASHHGGTITFDGPGGRIRHKNGNWLWLEITVTDLMYDPVINGIVLNFHDISARKIAEQQLHESDIFHKGILASLTAHIAVIDRSGKILSVNKAWDEFAQQNGAYPDPAYSTGGNYLDTCRSSIATGDLLAKEAYEGIIAVFENKCSTFSLEYPCHSPEEKRWFVLRVMHFGNDLSKVVISHQDITDRKNAENNIIKNEKKFRSLIENSVEGMAILDMTGNPVYVSPSVVNVLGYTEEEAMNLNLLALAHDDDKPLLMELMGRVMQQPGIPVKGEATRMLHKDGNWRWIEGVITNLLHDEDIHGIVDNFRDVTANVLARNALLKSEVKYRSLFETSMDGMLLTSAMSDGNIFSANPAACATFRMTEAEIIAAGRSGLLSESDTGFKAFLEERERTGQAKGEITFIRKDGSIFDAEVSSAMFKNSIGEPRASFILRDITERKQAEQKLLDTSEALQNALNDLKKIMDASMDVICAIDETGKFVNVSSASVNILGYNPEELCGTLYLDMVFPEDLAETVIAADKIMKGTPVTMFENRYIHKDGRIIPILWSARWDENDKLMYCIAKDATEKKKLEKAVDIERQRFYELFTQAPSAIGILKGPNHIFEMVNPLYLKLIGRKDIIGKSLKEVLPEIEGQGYIKLVDRVYKTGKSISANEKLINIDREGNGTPTSIYLNFINQAYRNRDGVIEGIFFFTNDVTEQVLLRKKIEKSAIQYRQIVETAQEGIWLLDENHRTVFVNSKLCEILGYPEDEIIGKEMYCFMDAEGKRIVSMLAENSKRKVDHHSDIKYISKEGKAIWTSVSANQIYDENGYKGVLAMLSDITEKKSLEVLLEKATRLAKIGSFEMDLTSNSLYWSPITKEIHGVAQDFNPDPEEVSVFYNTAPGSAAVFSDLVKNIREHFPIDLESLILTANGESKWIRTVIEGEFINGVCVKLNGSLQDIDTVKRAELELIKVYEERNSILESIGDGFFAIDKNWIVTYWNNQSEKMLGKTKEEMIGASFWDVYPQVAGSQTHVNYLHAIETGEVIHFETYYDFLNQWYDISAYPSHNGLSVFFQDITAKKQAEAERAQMIRDTVERNKDLEQFSYIVSHNLRAPVANIIGLGEEMNLNEYVSEKQKPFVKALLSNIKRLDNVITDLNQLLQAKDVSGKNKETVNLGEMINNIQSSIQNLIQQERVTLMTDFPEIQDVYTVKSYLYSIFFNLISNSIKYKQPGIAPFINISTRSSGKKVHIRYNDNGSGIDLSRHGEQVFGMYARFHQHIEGRGIGLFMVKTQVEALGGKISIASEINYGTTFSIEFNLY